MFKAFPFAFRKSDGGTLGDQAIIPGGVSGIPFNPKAFLWVTAGHVDSGEFSSGPPGPDDDPRRWMLVGMGVPPGQGSVVLGAAGGTPNVMDQVLRACFAADESIGYGNFYDEGHCVGFMDNLGAFGTARVSAKGKLQSIDDLGGGFFGITMNWPNNESDEVERWVGCVAFGGDDIDVELAHWSVTSTVGAGKTARGTSIRPDTVLTMGGPTQPGPSTTGPGYTMVLSAMNCVLQQIGCAVDPSNGGGQAVGSREYDLTSMIPTIGDDATHTATQTLTAMLLDGWEYETTGPGLAGAYGYGLHSLVFRNVSSQIGSFTKPISELGPQDVPTPNMTPIFAWLFGVNSPAAVGIQNHDRMASGFATADAMNCSAWSSARMPDITPMSGVIYIDKAYAVVNNDDELAQSLISSVSFEFGKIIPNWEVCDAEETVILMCAMGSGIAGTCEINLEIDTPITVVYEVSEPLVENSPLPTISELAGGNPEISPPIKVRPDGKPILSPSPTSRRVLPTQGG